MALAAPTLQEELLGVMDRKDHWAWSHFEEGRASRAQLLEHYRQEFGVYVCDFPMFLGRVHCRCPHAEVRRDLAENLFEEETGKLSLGLPHPELFLLMMEGLGFERRQFDGIHLLPEAAAYRGWIDQVTLNRPWVEGAAVVTLFIEGSVHDRQRIREMSPEPGDVDAELNRSFLVRHYGVDPRYMGLKRAHGMVEDGHRHAAWKMIMDHAADPQVARRLLHVLRRTLDLWLEYRDGVARACTIRPLAPMAGRAPGSRVFR